MLYILCPGICPELRNTTTKYQKYTNIKSSFKFFLTNNETSKKEDMTFDTKILIELVIFVSWR